MIYNKSIIRTKQCGYVYVAGYNYQGVYACEYETDT